MAQIKAIFFDQDGVIIDTERDGHRVSFNETFKEFGYDVDWDVEYYHELLQVGGGIDESAGEIEQQRARPQRPSFSQKLGLLTCPCLGQRLFLGSCVSCQVFGSHPAADFNFCADGLPQQLAPEQRAGEGIHLNRVGRFFCLERGAHQLKLGLDVLRHALGRVAKPVRCLCNRRHRQTSREQHG